MKLYEKLINREANLAVVGLGYVGLPIAVAFAEKVNTIGFDINEEKIADYQNVNCTPIVRQYDILKNNWGDFLCQREYQTKDIRQSLRSV